MARPSVDHDTILAAAAELSAAHGFQRVRMDEIARHAGVAKGVLYLRFDGKDALLRAMVSRELRLAVEATLALVEADPLGGRFSRLFAHSLEALQSRPALLALYRDDAITLGRLTRQRNRISMATRALLGADFIRRMQEAGLVRADIDVPALATNLALWNFGLAARAPRGDVGALILGMGDLMARAVDVDGGDVAAGKRCFAAFAAGLIAELGAP